MATIKRAATRHVICDGQWIDVSANLFDALSTLRRCVPTELRQIWIDAICIDQENTEERSSQVAQMNTIFSSAASVIAWLGPADRYTSPLHKTIRSLRPCDLRPFERYDGFRNIDEESVEMSRLPPLDPTASLLMLCPALFRRVWVIQEVMLAKAIRTFVGNAELSWEDLGKLFAATYTTLLVEFHGFVPENMFITRTTAPSRQLSDVSLNWLEASRLRRSLQFAGRQQSPTGLNSNARCRPTDGVSCSMLHASLAIGHFIGSCPQMACQEK